MGRGPRRSLSPFMATTYARKFFACTPCIPRAPCYNTRMNSKTITLAVMFLIVGIVMVLPSEETIKPTTSQKDKVLKSQGILLAALAIIGIL